jgi:serine/threonine protein kinase
VTVPPSRDADLQGHLAQALGDAFVVDGEVGRGGMGIVYRARDTRLKRAVAVKVLPPDLAFRADVRIRFLREAETAAQLSHAHIVPIYTVDERDGLVYFIMAFIDGETLARHMPLGVALPIDDVRRIMREVADALAYAHSRGVIHRDIKPDNILLDREGMHAWVTDFGIARALTSEGGDGSGSRLTNTGVVIGTPAYMSPEQCAGDRAVDGRSDLYSLGLVAYQMLTGNPPFAGTNTAGMLVKQLTETPVPIAVRRPDIPPDLATLVMQLLEKDPERRPQTAGALLAGLDGTPIPGPPPRAAASTVAEKSDVDSAELEKRIRKFRRRLGQSVTISIFLIVLNIATEAQQKGRHEWWWTYPVGALALVVIMQSVKLTADGANTKEAWGPFWPGRLLSLRLPWARSTPAGAAGLTLTGTAAQVAAQTDTNAAQLVPRQVLDGPYGSGVRRAVADQLSIAHLFGTLDKEERVSLPTLPTTSSALLNQVGMVAVALHRIDVDTPVERRPALARRRDALLQLFERASQALEALSLDLIRLRSAGLSGSHTTGEAARSDIEHVLRAAAELHAPDE